MSPDWRNPCYERELKRRRSLAALAILVLAAAGTAAYLVRRQGERAPAPSAAGPRETAPPASAVPSPDGGQETFAEASSLAGGEALEDANAPAGAQTAPAAGVAAAPETFAALKERALSLYRRNDLEGAREQAQAALALRRDGELIELLLKLRREIAVQRDYDGARTANFTVLYDGYEHEEMKVLVLDILKSAYADIGKELDHFPAEPITVILYTGKDFSDVTRAPGWAGGMFGKADGKIRLPVQGAEGQERALRRVITHEYVHALVHALAPSAPMWLHEGLAQYLSGDRAVSVAQVIPLPMLDRGFPADARTAYAAYMVSLQAVTDLVDERGMPPLRRLLAELGAGKGIEPAFAAAYGEPFSRWARQWRPVERGEESGEQGDAAVAEGDEDGSADGRQRR
jgi:hypothetical protein